MAKYLYEKVARGVVRRHKVNDTARLPVPVVDSRLHTQPRFVLDHEVILKDPIEVRREPDPNICEPGRIVGFSRKLSRH
ncbi:MAG: hypothetical protein PHW63_10875 [Alphaproteobacteria bacterium]|nr:hypothetical protein [Alphaproteobacteria bacterium]